MKIYQKHDLKRNLAPIALFCFNRPSHLKKSIDALKKNYSCKNSKIYIFSDAAKNSNDLSKVDKVRSILKNLEGFKEKKLIIRKKNYGTSKNITTGLNYVFKKYEKCIIIEDDILVSKFFLYQMNYFLNKYNSNKKLASVEGYMYPVAFSKDVPDYYFLRGAGCWGWGTWKRSWKNYEASTIKLIKKFKNNRRLIRDFNYDNSYPYYKMLLRQLKTNRESWAIKWYATNFLRGNNTLYFKNSLVKNIGLDNTGVNCRIDYDMNQKKFSTKKIKFIKNKNTQEDVYTKRQISRYLKNKFKFSQKIFFLIKSFF